MMKNVFVGRVGLSRLLGAAALLSLGAAVQAQEAPGVPGQTPGQGAGRPGRQRGRQQREMPAVTAFKASSPTAEQQTKFDALQTKMRDEMMAMRNGNGGNNGDMRTKMQEMNQKFQDDTLAILTPAQQKTYKLELAKAQGDLTGQLETLELTADQLKQVRPLVRDTQQELRKLGQDNALSATDRQTKTDTLVKDLKAKVRPILTTEQQTKLDAMDLKANTMGRGGFGGGRGGQGRGGQGRGNAGGAGAEGGVGAPPPAIP